MRLKRLDHWDGWLLALDSGSVLRSARCSALTPRAVRHVPAPMPSVLLLELTPSGKTRVEPA